MKVHKKTFCKTTKKHHCLKQRILPILFIFSLLCSAAAFPQETAAVTAVSTSDNKKVVVKK